MGFKSNKKKLKYSVKPVEVVSGVDAKKDVPKDPTILPNTFKFAAESLKIMSDRGGSAGSVVVNNYKSYNYKLIYALVMNTVKNIKIIKKIIHNLKLMKSLHEDNPFLIEIMLGDFLFGQGLKSVSKNPIAVAIRDRKDDILKEQNELKHEFPSKENSLRVAKYLRVNHLKCDMSYVISQLKAIGLDRLEYSKEKIKFKKFVTKYKNMSDNEFMVDFHFPNDLIVLKAPAAKKLLKTPLLRSNKASFQDKASFLAVEALDVKPSQNIIDACFAPGIKTSLIAMKMKNKGKILAYDRDKKRLVSAIRFLHLQGVTNVTPQCSDFSSIKLRRLPKVHKIESFDSILIDPSCSGSGIESRLDYKRSNEEAGRLKKLQAFQVALLKQALQARVSKRIVYCTCSTSVEENEQVVEMALNESGVKDKWEMIDALPYWPQRGDSNFEFGLKCLRSGTENLTNGFFIAKFQNIEFNKTADVDQNDQSRPTKRCRFEQDNINLKSKAEADDNEFDEQEGDDVEDEESDRDEDEEENDDDEEETDQDEEVDEDEEDESGDDDASD